ncbi:MAG: exodeoxyribonuclease VII large subunit [Nitrospinota bacterium]|nr:exodeoxyribonuclease VII large subunit [Nitrospinota bacterium]
MSEEKQGPKVYSVTEVTQDIKAIIESAFDSAWIEGEISNLRVAASHHAYFVLKDPKAQIRCVLFKGYRAGLKYQPEDGDHVLLFGRVTVYDARGEYQVIVETMEPRGLGALQKAFEQLKEKLAKEGLFDESKKKPIPPMPWKVGVITSSTGAAIRDILQIIWRRNPKVSVLVHPVKVQGEGAAKEIAQAIREMNRLRDIDVLIVGRGGGSIEDLWAFNEEEVGRSIFASRIPVVSAVGHEIDFTIADFVADLRAPTPSAAAELTVPVLKDMVQSVRFLTGQLMSKISERIESYKDRLRYLIERRFFREPTQILQPVAQRLDEMNLRLIRGLDQSRVLQKQKLLGMVQQLFQASPEKTVIRQKERLYSLKHLLVQQTVSTIRLEKGRFDGLAKNLNALSPLSILDRGYSICTHEGKVVKTSPQVHEGDSIQVRLSRGELECKVENTLKPNDP